MKRKFQLLTLCAALALPCAAQTHSQPVGGFAEAYYRFALGRFYDQLALENDNADYVERAVYEYRAAIQADPGATHAAKHLIDLYASTSRLEVAAQILAELQNRIPDHPEIPRLAGRIYLAYAYDGGRLDREMAIKAIDAYAQALVLEPNDIELLLALGAIRQDIEQPDEAERHLRRVLELEPFNADALAMSADLHLQRGDMARAIQALEAAMSISGDPDRLLEALARIYEKAGRFDDAADAYAKLAEGARDSGWSANPDQRSRANEIRFLEHSGRLNRLAGNFQAARDAYAQIASADPGASPRVRQLVVDTLRAERDYERALIEAQRAVDEFPQNQELKALYVTVLVETGRAAEAAGVLESTLSEEPSDFDTYLGLAQLWQKDGNIERAQQALTDAERLVDVHNRSTYLLTRALILEQLKFYDEAEEAIRSVAEPSNAAALNHLGYMLADRNVKLDEAHDLIQRALAIDPDNSAFLDSLGWVYFRQGRFDLAEVHLLRSLEKQGRDVIVLSHLGDVYFAVGDRDKAQKYWQRALEEWKQLPEGYRDQGKIAELNGKLAKLSIVMGPATGAHN